MPRDRRAFPSEAISGHRACAWHDSTERGPRDAAGPATVFLVLHFYRPPSELPRVGIAVKQAFEESPFRLGQRRALGDTSYIRSIFTKLHCTCN